MRRTGSFSGTDSTDTSGGPDTAPVLETVQRSSTVAGASTQGPPAYRASEPTGRVPMVDTMLGGHYRLQSRLGHGGMADVWRALDERLDRPVAIKLFRPEATQPQRERNEMRLLANLNHPGLVTVFDAGIADDSYGTAHSYLVMELISGPTLSQQLDQGSIEAAVVARLGAELAGAFAYIHQRGIVHRDVKPANILLVAPLTSGDVFQGVKLTDFGIARMLDDTRLTEHGMTIGTPNYLSPEQVHGDELTPASDVYSLALLLLECLTGQVVYPGHGIEAAVARLHRTPQVPIELGPAWADALNPMLYLDPAARPSAAAVARALQRVDEQGWTITPPAATSASTTVGSRTAGSSQPAAYLTSTDLPSTDLASTDLASTDLASADLPTPLAVVPARPLSSEPAALASDPPASPAQGASPVPWDDSDTDSDTDTDTDSARRGLGWLIAAAVLLVVLVALVWFIVHSSGSHRSPGPSYPAVTGKLGSDLSNLQKDVRP